LTSRTILDITDNKRFSILGSRVPINFLANLRRRSAALYLLQRFSICEDKFRYSRPSLPVDVERERIQFQQFRRVYLRFRFARAYFSSAVRFKNAPDAVRKQESGADL